jgi:hypothetical protein
MPAIALRQDFDAAQPRSLARARRDARQVRRLLALAAVYDGASRGESAALGGMDRQLLRDWALRFNAEGPGGLIDRKAPGARSKLTPEQLSGCRPWRAWSRMARSRPSTGWSAGGSSIWWGGSTTSTACRWTPAGWAGSSKAWATRAFRRGPSITLRRARPGGVQERLSPSGSRRSATSSLRGPSSRSVIKFHGGSVAIVGHRIYGPSPILVRNA